MVVYFCWLGREITGNKRETLTFFLEVWDGGNWWRNWGSQSLNKGMREIVKKVGVGTKMENLFRPLPLLLRESAPSALGFPKLWVAFVLW